MHSQSASSLKSKQAMLPANTNATRHRHSARARFSGFFPSLAFCVGALLLAAPVASLADEGMWLFNAPPRKVLKERYGFEPTATWLEHLQKASVRFNSGGSGSFISKDGLIISNHHIGIDDLQKLSDADHDYVKSGFQARSAPAATGR
jgi:hypothetical protein